MTKLTISILSLLALTMAGCDETTHIGVGFGDRIVTMEHDGHSYIVYKGADRGGITHDPDCPCRESSVQSLGETKEGGQNDD